MTPLPLSIAFAHLRARKRQTAVSIGGVMLGVAIFIGIGGMMNGFHSYFLSQLVETNPHIIITDEFRQAASQPLTMLYPEGAVEIRRVLPRDPVRGISGAAAILDALNAMPGVTCLRPEGAFYAFPNFSSFGLSSAELQQGLLDEAGVACVAGPDFGRWGEGYLRLSYAASVEDLRVALAAMGRYLHGLDR